MFGVRKKLESGAITKVNHTFANAGTLSHARTVAAQTKPVDIKFDSSEVKPRDNTPLPPPFLNRNKRKKMNTAVQRDVNIPIPNMIDCKNKCKSVRLVCSRALEMKRTFNAPKLGQMFVSL